MKKIARIVSLMIVIVCFFSSVPFADAASNIVDAQVGVEFDQTGARAMLPLLNDFRLHGDDGTGSPWYWSSNNVTKIYPNAKALSYDYTLEAIAMQRCVEAAISYSHTRPDGSRYSTVPGFTAYYNRGENICVGFSYLDTAQSAMDIFRESYYNYSGQGHRRNMLADYTSVGVAHVYYNGCHYWVQEFGTPTLNATPTPAVDGYTIMNVKIANGFYQLNANVSSVEAQVGIPCELPTLDASVITGTAYPGYPCPLAGAAWSVADSKIATINGNTLNPKAEGSTQLIGTCCGQTISIPLTVTKAAESKVDIQLSGSCFAYNGSKQVPTVTVTTENGKTLKKGADYSISFSNGCTEIGSYTVTVTGKNPYSFSETLSFEIVSAIKLPPILSTIEADAFSEMCAQMIIVPASVNVIESRAFANCTGLKVLTFESNPTSIDSSILEGCGNVTVRVQQGGSAESWAKGMGYPVEYL